jgi:DNA ligase-1
MMKQVFDVLTQLRATNSSNDKLAILQANKDDADLKAYLRMAYEPRINFYQRKVDTKVAKGKVAYFDNLTGEPNEFTFDVMAEVYDTLAKRDLTGNAAKTWLTNLYADMASDWSKELLQLLIQRDVKAGVSTGSINKVWPGLITNIPYMRCTLPAEANLDAWPWERGVYSEIKADGQFANVYHHKGGAVSIESRNGSPMPLDYFGDVVTVVKHHVPEGFVLHGELLLFKDGKMLPRQEGNGKFNSLLQDGELEPGYRIEYHAWDIIPIDEFKPKNKYNVPRVKRIAQLEAFIGAAGQSAVKLIEYKLVYSVKEARLHAKNAMERGLEGTVVKHPDGIWQDSDGSKDQVKIKLQMDIDVRLVGLKAADTKSKNKDLFGSLMCESECGKFRCNAAGLSDAERLDIYNRRDELLGKRIITITINGLMEPSQDTEGYWSGFLPRFIEERLDKTKADTLEQMKAIQQAAIEQESFAESKATRKKAKAKK